jgi:hypothetical protein
MVLGAEGRDQGRWALLKYRGEWSDILTDIYDYNGLKNIF